MTTRNRYRTALLAGLGVAACLHVATAAAQQMGRDPWRPPPRNPSLAAQFDMQQRAFDAAAASTAAGMAALQQFVTSYNASSTSIGNLNQITQILGDGANAVVGATDQTSIGDQGADATTDVALDQSFTDSSRTTIAGDQNNTSTVNNTVTPPPPPPPQPEAVR